MISDNQVRKLITAIVAVTWTWSLAFGVGNAEQKPRTETMSNEQLLGALKATDVEEAHQVVLEIMRRGEVMLPGLLALKGNRDYFHGYGLGNRDSSFLIALPTGNRKRDEGRVITIEVVALYLVSAIYHQTLEFAQAPYLTDGTPIRMRRFNTRHRVAKAWLSLDNWSQLWKKEGLESLRKKNDAPLKGPGIHFW